MKGWNKEKMAQEQKEKMNDKKRWDEEKDDLIHNLRYLERYLDDVIFNRVAGVNTVTLPNGKTAYTDALYQTRKAIIEAMGKIDDYL